MTSRRHGSAVALAAWAVLALATLAPSCSGKAVIDGDGQTTSGSGDCPERVRPVACRADPPVCPSGQFPAADADGSCWTGDCIDCVDGCQSDDECVVVDACGCSHHEGCSWAETRFRAALLDPCIASGGRPCTGSCPSSFCSTLDCPWCSADAAVCDSGSCRSVVSHVCY